MTFYTFCVLYSLPCHYIALAKKNYPCDIPPAAQVIQRPTFSSACIVVKHVFGLSTHDRDSTRRIIVSFPPVVPKPGLELPPIPAALVAFTVTHGVQDLHIHSFCISRHYSLHRFRNIIASIATSKSERLRCVSRLCSLAGSYLRCLSTWLYVSTPPPFPPSPYIAPVKSLGIVAVEAKTRPLLLSHWILGVDSKYQSLSVRLSGDF